MLEKGSIGALGTVDMVSRQLPSVDLVYMLAITHLQQGQYESFGQWMMFHLL